MPFAVGGYPYDGTLSQLWTASIWDPSAPFCVAFANFATGQYLAPDRSVPSRLGHEVTFGTRLSRAVTSFDWQLVRHRRDSTGYRLLVPFTRNNIELHKGKPAPGTLIYLQPHKEEMYWRFEEVPMAAGQEPQMEPQPDMSPWGGVSPGPPER